MFSPGAREGEEGGEEYASTVPTRRGRHPRASPSSGQQARQGFLPDFIPCLEQPQPAYNLWSGDHHGPDLVTRRALEKLKEQAAFKSRTGPPGRPTLHGHHLPPPHRPRSQEGRPAPGTAARSGAGIAFPHESGATRASPPPSSVSTREMGGGQRPAAARFWLLPGSPQREVLLMGIRVY